MQQSKTIGRRELLRGGGVAALAVGAAAVVPLAAMATPSEPYKDAVRAFAHELLAGPGRLTVGEWIERKRIALTMLVLIGEEYQPWTEDELFLMANIESHRWVPPKAEAA
jgi:hypothetical protein